MEKILDIANAFVITISDKNITGVKWDMGYQNLEWFSFVYCFLKREENPKPNIIQKAFKYKIDTITGVIWIYRGADIYLSYILENHILFIL